MDLGKEVSLGVGGCLCALGSFTGTCGQQLSPMRPRSSLVRAPKSDFLGPGFMTSQFLISVPGPYGGRQCRERRWDCFWPSRTWEELSPANQTWPDLALQKSIVKTPISLVTVTLSSLPKAFGRQSDSQEMAGPSQHHGWQVSYVLEYWINMAVLHTFLIITTIIITIYWGTAIHFFLYLLFRKKYTTYFETYLKK